MPALMILVAGHLPVMGEWCALPLIEHAGSDEMVAIARNAGRPVYFALAEIPPAN